eukprot:scaffold38599_cov75-Phaeocystis_antarctica.AAC.3
MLGTVQTRAGYSLRQSSEAAGNGHSASRGQLTRRWWPHDERSEALQSHEEGFSDARTWWGGDGILFFPFEVYRFLLSSEPLEDCRTDLTQPTRRPH